jgi:hypothetical protein
LCGACYGQWQRQVRDARPALVHPADHVLVKLATTPSPTMPFPAGMK